MLDLMQFCRCFPCPAVHLWDWMNPGNGHRWLLSLKGILVRGSDGNRVADIHFIMLQRTKVNRERSARKECARVGVS
jgi:hypothetical protein